MLLKIQFYLVVFAIAALSYPIFVVTLCDALHSLVLPRFNKLVACAVTLTVLMLMTSTMRSKILFLVTLLRLDFKMKANVHCFVPVIRHLILAREVVVLVILLGIISDFCG